MHGRDLGVNPDDLVDTPDVVQEAKQEILENKDVSTLHCTGLECHGKWMVIIKQLLWNYPWITTIITSKYIENYPWDDLFIITLEISGLLNFWALFQKEGFTNSDLKSKLRVWLSLRLEIQDFHSPNGIRISSIRSEYIQPGPTAWVSEGKKLLSIGFQNCDLQWQWKNKVHCRQKYEHM